MIVHHTLNTTDNHTDSNSDESDNDSNDDNNNNILLYRTAASRSTPTTSTARTPPRGPYDDIY